MKIITVSYTHLDVYKRQVLKNVLKVIVIEMFVTSIRNTG